MATGQGNLPYPISVVSAFDIILAQTTNEENANIGALADGTGIGDEAVTPSKLGLGAASGVANSGESTTSTTFGNLTTNTDTATVDIGNNGLALVSIFANMVNNTSTGQSQVSFEVSGANTLAPSEGRAIVSVHPANYSFAIGATFLLTGLSTGSTTFKMKYRRLTAGTSTFSYRNISVVPL